MPGSEKIGTTHVWRRRFYRRPAGLGWLLALGLVPLLLAGLGYGFTNRSNINGPNLTLPSISGPKLPGLSFSPLAILRNGNAFTLSGDIPDAGVRTSLIDMLKGVYGNGIQLVDNLNIKPGSNPIDFSGLSGVLKAAAAIPDFNFKVNGNTVSLTGTAASEDENAAVESAAIDAWPDMNISNDMSIQGQGAEPSPTSTEPTSTEPTTTQPTTTQPTTTQPTSTEPTSTSPSAGAGSADCANLQSDITTLMKNPITFVTNGYTLSGASQRQLSQVAQKLSACPDARVTVNGYTDNTGNDAINGPLSNNRARSVVDYLVSQGVPADHVSAKGHGSADPVASNDTDEGRAQNRRTTIAVS